VLKLLEATLPKSIRIEERIDTGCGFVLADPTQIHQVVMNLCTNAYQAMRKPGGTLGITLERVPAPPKSVTGMIDPSLKQPQSYIKLEINDTGPGMSQAIKERIFDPYFTTKDKGEGTGLGLAVVHGIVKSHNGYITVDSQPGTGTSFKVYLPYLQYGKDTAKKLPDLPVPGGSEHILLVDDEEQLVHMGKAILEKLGYRVTATTNADEAVESFKGQPESFDLVITDMSMPRMTGTQLAKKLMDIEPGIPIILCTGFSEMVNETQAKLLGFRGFVMKPVLLKELGNLIRKVLDEDNP
jgi:CheY-like chemotaxis protein